MCACVREDGQTDRQTDPRTHTHTHLRTDRQIDDRPTNTHTHALTQTHTHTHTQAKTIKYASNNHAVYQDDSYRLGDALIDSFYRLLDRETQ